MSAVAQAMTKIHTDKKFTLDEVRAEVTKNLPRTTRSAGGGESYFMRMVNFVQAQAFTTVVNSETGASPKRGREYTREEDKAHIKKQSETIRDLRAQLKANRGEQHPSSSGGSSGPSGDGGGHGRGRGRGRGRGHSVNAAESPASQQPSPLRVEPQAENVTPTPAGSAALAFQVFCTEIADRPQLHKVSTVPCSPVDSESTSSEAEEQDTGTPDSTAVYEDASEEQPGSDFLRNDEHPDPPRHFDNTPTQATQQDQDSADNARPLAQSSANREASGYIFPWWTLFIIVGVTAGVVQNFEYVSDCFSTMSRSLCALLTTAICGVSGTVTYHSRVKSPISSLVVWFVATAVLAVLLFAPGTYGIDIQEPGRPRSLLYTPQPYQFSSPNVAEFLEQRAAVLNMVTQGDPSVFETKWCVDGGANRHVHPVPSDFKNFTSVPITVHVAKKGAVMQAIGTGDIDLHSVDNMGNPCVLTLKDVLCIPDANKSLISVSMLSKDGYQVIYPCPDPVFPPGIYQPRKNAKPGGASRKHIPFQCLNDLYYINTRNDLHDESGGPLTRSNKYLIWSRKLGHCSMEVLRKTRECVVGLEDLADAHFPRNYVAADVQLGKLKQARQPKLTGHVAERCMAAISWDTAGPTKTRSINGYNYVTVFVCRYSMYYWAYGHHSTAQIPELFDKFYADTAPLREKHGPILSVRRDRASVNISDVIEKRLVQLGIRSETSNSYEPWQNGDAERAIGTLSGIARTVMLASGLVGRFWFSGFCYATVVHNITYSEVHKSSPHVLMHGEKPDISHHQQFGCEAFLYRADDQHKGKWDARAEKGIFVGYPANQKGYLLWCPGRGPNAIVSTTNCYFGSRLPYATRPAVEIIGSDHR